MHSRRSDRARTAQGGVRLLPSRTPSCLQPALRQLKHQPHPYVVVARHNALRAQSHRQTAFTASALPFAAASLAGAPFWMKCSSTNMLQQQDRWLGTQQCWAGDPDARPERRLAASTPLATAPRRRHVALARPPIQPHANVAGSRSLAERVVLERRRMATPTPNATPPACIAITIPQRKPQRIYNRPPLPASQGSGPLRAPRRGRLSGAARAVPEAAARNSARRTRVPQQQALTIMVLSKVREELLVVLFVQGAAQAVPVREVE